jgi:hypothetical protein
VPAHRLARRHQRATIQPVNGARTMAASAGRGPAPVPGATWPARREGDEARIISARAPSISLGRNAVGERRQTFS